MGIQASSHSQPGAIGKKYGEGAPVAISNFAFKQRFLALSLYYFFL